MSWLANLEKQLKDEQSTPPTNAVSASSLSRKTGLSIRACREALVKGMTEGRLTRQSYTVGGSRVWFYLDHKPGKRT